VQAAALQLHLEALATPQKAAVVEHVAAGWVQRPVAALTGPIGSPGQLDEAVVEGKIVTQRVLPALCVLAVVRKPIGDKLIDFT